MRQPPLTLVEALPHEFRVEAERLIGRRRKKIDDIKRAERNR
jgi:hypothetical protein